MSKQLGYQTKVIRVKILRNRLFRWTFFPPLSTTGYPNKLMMDLSYDLVAYCKLLDSLLDIVLSAYRLCAG